MSFSFRIKADTKDAAKAAAKEYMAGIVKQQPVHAGDSNSVLAATNSYIDLLGDPEEGDEIIVTVSGSLSWYGDQNEQDFVSANVGINAALANKENK